MPLFTSVRSTIKQLSSFEHLYVLFDIEDTDGEFNSTQGFDTIDEDSVYQLSWDGSNESFLPEALSMEMVNSPAIRNFIYESSISNDEVATGDECEEYSNIGEVAIFCTSEKELRNAASIHEGLETPLIVDVKNELLKEKGNLEMIQVPLGYDVNSKSGIKAYMLKNTYDKLKDDYSDASLEVMNEYEC